MIITRHSFIAEGQDGRIVEWFDDIQQPFSSQQWDELEHQLDAEKAQAKEELFHWLGKYRQPATPF